MTETKRVTLVTSTSLIDNRYNLTDIRCVVEANRVVVPLRVFLVLLFGILVVFQTMSLPGQFAYMAQHAYLMWPAAAVTVFWCSASRW